MNKDLIINNLLTIKNIGIKNLPIILIVFIITLLIIALSLGFSLGLQPIEKNKTNSDNINSMIQYNIQKIEENERKFGCDRILQKAIIYELNSGCSNNGNICNDYYRQGLYYLKNNCRIASTMNDFPKTKCSIPITELNLGPGLREYYIRSANIQ